MEPAAVRILNFDDSVVCQTEFVRASRPAIVPLTDLGRSARLWADRHQADAIRGRLNTAQKHVPTFIGSGDYHYVSALLLEQFNEPFSLIVFDHHPDWDIMPPHRGCGSWVSRALENPQVAHVILAGNASDDLSFPSLITGNRKSAQSGRVTLLPYELPTRPFWPWNAWDWRELKADPVRVFDAALQKLPTKKVYISIDKDCLTSAYALTNWEEGRLHLDLLFTFLGMLKNKHQILGLDVTGDYSAPMFSGRWKSWCSRIDHPREYSAKGRSPEEIVSINGSTNRKIIDFLQTVTSSGVSPPYT